MSNEKRIVDLRRELQKKSIPFYNIFSSPEGQLVLTALKQEFDRPVLAAGNEFQTVINAAQHDVIEYIETMIKLREENYE